MKMKLHDHGVYLVNGQLTDTAPAHVTEAEARKGTIAYGILKAHNTAPDMKDLRIKFDSMTSHDITYVGIIQTARASGMEKFPLPYVLTNCHNSLCAVGGTINEDDHQFALSAAHKYGGIYVPPNMAVIHSYNREMMAGCGRMILGSDSHTRYGALGTMGVGEGGPEIVKQLLKNTYDIAAPEVILVWLTGQPPCGVGPHDVAIALCGAVYKNGFVKNKVLEFAGPAVSRLPMDYRIGIDVMTTETACLSSIWETDGAVADYLTLHGREEAFTALHPQDGAYYDGMITIDLDRMEPMAALPFHPSEAVTLRELLHDPGDHLREVEKRAAAQFGGKAGLHLTDKLVDGKLVVDQGIIAGCAGGMYDNIAEAAAILDGHDTGSGYFSLSVYPPSVPVNLELMENGVQQSLLASGALFKPCFCGPCFGAGDVPANNGLSIRHTTRNFPNREGSKPADGQLAGVILMDARSIAATARNHGVLTSAADVDYTPPAPVQRRFDRAVYDRRVYFGFGKAQPDAPLRYGPNIAEWPAIPALSDDLLMQVASVLRDEVTTTDELIPSGETSSYRSNPLGLAEFTLSRKDPAYVGRAKAVQAEEAARRAGQGDAALLAKIRSVPGCEALTWDDVQLASTIFAVKPGDGSAREQAASCQRVLGAGANIVNEYATKRYRSNLINWGMLPFQLNGAAPFGLGDYILIPHVREALKGDLQNIPAYVLGEEVKPFALYMAPLTSDEREILADGCLINYYKH